MTAAILALAGLMAQAAAGEFPPQADSADSLRNAARAAEVRYERLVRRLAPLRMGGFNGSSCDEVVGRFCVRYDAPGDPPLPAGPEPAELTESRRAAIESLRAAFSVLPGDFETAGSLVRYLIEDGRPAEAIPAARLYAAVSADSVRGPLLEGFAEHAAGRTEEALVSFGVGLARMGESGRQRIERIDWLLENADRRVYAELDSTDRRRFEERFWRFSDPLYLTPGNEALAEHTARHVWSRILEDGPVVLGMQKWGSDLEQLTVRFGMPASRTRLAGPLGTDDAIVDHFDPMQMAFSPASMADGLPPTPLPGQPWELARMETRAGYAAMGGTTVRFLTHQLSRFPGPAGTRVRFDAEFSDSLLASSDRIRIGHWLLDTLGNVRDGGSRWLRLVGDTARFSFETDAEPGDWVYALETLDTAGGVAGRARYSLDIDTLRPGPLLSDPVILRPFRQMPRPEGRSDPGFRPVADLVFTRRDTVGVYVEAAGLRAGGETRLRLSLQRASRDNLPSRLLGWIGRKVGLGSSHDPVFVEWNARAGSDGRMTFAFEIPPQDIDDGDYVLIARLTALASGLTVESRRVLRYSDPPR